MRHPVLLKLLLPFLLLVLCNHALPCCAFLFSSERAPARLFTPAPPPPPPPPYDEHEALSALYYNKAAYCPVELVVNGTCGPTCDALGPDFHLYSAYDNTTEGTFAYVGLNYRTRRVVAAFRGSKNLANWIDNLRFFSTPYPSLVCPGNCTVHRGFLRAYLTLQEEMLLDVLTLRLLFPTYRLLVTGHSLGGALAQLLALDLVQLEPHLRRLVESHADGGARSFVPGEESVGEAEPFAVIRPMELMTFGAPRLGNSALVEWAVRVFEGHRVYRVTHRRDMVPHLPPAYWSYLHIPHEIWYDDDRYPSGRRCADNATTEDSECSNSAWSTSVADHLVYLNISTSCGDSAVTTDEEADAP